MDIVKRNGFQTKFNKNKIKNAILKANNSVNKGYRIADISAEDIADSIEQECLSMNHIPKVEEVQDMVEDALIETGYTQLGKEYIRYRFLRNLQRRDRQDKKHYESVKEKLMAENVQNQNANVDEHSFGGRIGEASEYMTKQYALDYCVSKMARDNHLNNEIYIHDLGHYAVGDHNCLSMPLDKLLANGFNTRQTDVRPAQSINTAMQLVAVLFQLQSLNQFGGVAATHLDWTMVPYVRKSFAKHYNDGSKYFGGRNDFDGSLSIEDEQYKENEKNYQYAMDQTIKETHQAVEGMYHNLNTLQSRSGNQLPFTSINYGTCTLPEGRMITKSLLEVSIEGLGNLHRTSIFPCGIFKLKKGVNRAPGDPNYDLFRLALYSTSRRLYPNYANVDWSGNAGYDENDPAQEFSTMGK